jgi:hypothetical protein
VAAQAPATASNPQEVHAQAAELLHQKESEMINRPEVASPPVSFSSADSATTPTTTSTSIASPVLSGPAVASDASTAEVHARALEILRQQQQGSTPTVQPMAAAPTVQAAPTTTAHAEVKSAPDAGSSNAQEGTRHRNPNDESHARALELLRQQMQTNSTASASAPAPTTETKPEPVSLPPSQPTPSSAPQNALPSEPDRATEERAREILRQKQAEEEAAHQAPVKPTPTVGPGSTDNNVPYSKRSEERARQILREHAAGQPPSAPTPASTPTPATPAPTVAVTPAPATVPNDADVQERQRLALEVLRQQTAPTATQAPQAAPVGQSPAIDAQSAEILRRQDEEIARQLHTPPKPVQKPTPPPSAVIPSSTVTATPTPTATTVTPTATMTPSVTPAATPSNGPGSEAYTRQLEARAQELLHNNQAPTSTVTAAPTPTISTPTVTPAPAPTVRNDQYATPSVNPAPSPQISPATPTIQPATPTVQSSPAGPSDADIAAIHAKALDVLRATETSQPANVAPQNSPVATTPQISTARTRKEKLSELNALYKADKVTPAEYHDRRAKILSEPE